MRHLEAALRSVLPDLPGGWTSIEDVAKALDARPEPAAALVIDDGHALEGTAAEARSGGSSTTRRRGWRSSSPAACRPSINLPRLRVSGELLELGPDDLRFRAWEVEQLFRDVYHDPVLPGDLAVLARRHRGLGGGPAAVPPRDPRPVRRRAPAGPQRRRDERPAAARVPGPERAVRAARGPAAVPRRHLRAGPAVRAAVRSAARDDGQRRAARRARAPQRVHRPGRGRRGAFRYHEVLRQHLDRMLVEEVGEAEARARHARAGEVLEADGALPEALRAYCRAEDWDAVRRLLGGQGERLAATERSGWVDAVPPAIERHDPWVALAAARRARNDGRWSTAIDGYIRAESVFGPSRAADAPRRERQRHRRVAGPGRDADARRDRRAPERARPGAGAGRARRGAARRRVGAGRAGPAPPGGGRGRDRAAACSRGLPTRARPARSPVRRPGSGRSVAARLGGDDWDAPGDGPRDRGGGTGRVTVARAARSGARWRWRPRPAVGGRRGRDGERGGRRAQDPWGQALLDLAEAWARPAIRSGAWRAADAATGRSGGWGRACSRRGRAAWRRSRRRASGRRTPATPRWPRSRRVAPRDRRRRGCTPTRRWRTCDEVARRGVRAARRDRRGETGLVVPRAPAA